MAALGLTPARIRELLDALDTELGDLAEPFDLLVVGGAAIAMQWNPRRLTNDIDVVSTELPRELPAAVARVAADRAGVVTNWLNDAAVVAAPIGSISVAPTLFYQGRNFTVHVAGASYVLAMKLLAGRRSDRQDLQILIKAASVASRDELVELVDRAYPGVPLHYAARRLLDEAWDEYARARSSGS